MASLLAASRASNLGLVGCTRTDADMLTGFAIPKGSKPLLGTPETEFERPFPRGELEDGTNADAASG